MTKHIRRLSDRTYHELTDDREEIVIYGSPTIAYEGELVEFINRATGATILYRATYRAGSILRLQVIA